MANDFLLLVEDLKSARRVILSSARADHEALGLPEGEEPDTLVIDLAPLLGLDSAPHRLLTLANLDAVAFFRMSESSGKLAKQRLGWPAQAISDVVLLAAMHQSPSLEGSGAKLLDLYDCLMTRPALRALWLHLIERVGRAWPNLVRPELALEIFYMDQRNDLLAAGLEFTPPTLEEAAKVVEELALLPPEEQIPNALSP